MVHLLKYNNEAAIILNSCFESFIVHHTETICVIQCIGGVLVSVCVCVCVRVCLHSCMCMHIYALMYITVCLHVCMYPLMTFACESSAITA